MEPEQSTMITTAAFAAPPGRCEGGAPVSGTPPVVPPPVEVTVMMPLTSRPPSGRYSF